MNCQRYLKEFNQQKKSFNQRKIWNFNLSTSISSSKLKAKDRVRSIFAVFFKFFKHFNSFTFDRLILNIFYFFCLKNFFYRRNCFNLIYFVRTISMIKRLCSRIVFQTVLVFSSARFNFIMTRSIKLKSITRTEDSHFLSRLTHFEHFLNNENKRHCFCAAAQRTQTIIKTIRQVKSMRSTKCLLSSLLLSDMINLQNEDFKKEKWCYNPIILNKRF